MEAVTLSFIVSVQLHSFLYFEYPHAGFLFVSKFLQNNLLDLVRCYFNGYYSGCVCQRSRVQFQRTSTVFLKWLFWSYDAVQKCFDVTWTWRFKSQVTRRSRHDLDWGSRWTKCHWSSSHILRISTVSSHSIIVPYSYIIASSGFRKSSPNITSSNLLSKVRGFIYDRAGVVV